MKSSAKYVGLDVHQATTVATGRESSGEIIARSILPTEEAALLEFFAGMRGAVHVALEEGTQAQWLRDLLWKRVARVVVCDRRGAPRQGNKGDQVDSAQLSARRRDGVRLVRHPAHRPLPAGLYDFAVGVLRWNVRVEAYLLLLHDEYPPFSLE